MRTPATITALLLAVSGALAAAPFDSTVISSDDIGEISVQMTKRPTLLLEGLTSVTYKTSAIDMQSSPQRKDVYTLTALCAPKTAEVIRLFRLQTSTQYFVGGKFVEDTAHAHNPPEAMSLIEHKMFMSGPAGVVCKQANASLKR
jgi:hypothetical protein